MLEKVIEKTNSWKNAFAERYEGINAHSNWDEILASLRRHDVQFLNLWSDVAKQCGEFDENDKKILNTLPYFKEFVSLLPLIPEECLNDFYICREVNGNMSPLIPKRSLRNYFLGKLQEGDAIYMSLHQRFEKECRVYDVNVTIVQQEFTNLDILLKVGSLLKSKVISIRYTNKIDEKWLKAAKEN